VADEAPPASVDPDAAADPTLRPDLDDALRFLNLMSAASRRDIFETAVSVFALVDELIQSGLVDHAKLNERWRAIQQRELAKLVKDARVQIDEQADKYALTELPDIDCDARMHLCKGRCCTLVFPLSNQDLDERVVKWTYDQPYRIRQERTASGDKYCVHNDPTTHGCTVYHHRPPVCRTYSCREDARIWKDFEARIPADWTPSE